MRRHDENIERSHQSVTSHLSKGAPLALALAPPLRPLLGLERFQRSQGRNPQDLNRGRVPANPGRGGELAQRGQGVERRYLSGCGAMLGLFSVEAFVIGGSGDRSQQCAEGGRPKVRLCFKIKSHRGEGLVLLCLGTQQGAGSNVSSRNDPLFPDATE